MASRTLLAGLFVAALIAGCAATDDPFLAGTRDADVVAAARSAPRCKHSDNRDDCSITVTVSRTASGCRLTMEADQETISFPRRVQDRLIFWRLDDAAAGGGFVFTQDGIAIDGNASHDFDRAHRFDNGKGFQWRNRNPRAGDYYYAVHVKQTSSDAGCDLDPRIRNEN